MKDIPVKINGNTVSASEYNSQTQEEKNLVTDTGQILNEADNHQVSKSVSNYSSLGDFYNDTGTVDNVYVLTSYGSRQGITAYVVGSKIRFIPHSTNTAPATVNVAGLGIKVIVTYSNHPLVGGELQQGLVATLEYDGTNFRLATHNPSIAIYSSFINGLLLSNNVSDLQHDINLSAGSCSDSGNNFVMVNRDSAFIKQLDNTWVEGTGNGGRASTVALTTNTWYHYFGIAKVDGTFDAGFDTSIIATNLLSDASAYSFYRYLGSVLTDGSSDIVAFINFQNTHGRVFYWKTPIIDFSLPNPGTGTVLRTVRVPTGLKVIAIVNPAVTEIGNTLAIAYDIHVSSPLVDDSALTMDVVTNVGISWSGAFNQMHVLTDASAQLKFRLTNSSVDIRLRNDTIGWYM